MSRSSNGSSRSDMETHASYKKEGGLLTNDSGVSGIRILTQSDWSQIISNYFAKSLLRIKMRFSVKERGVATWRGENIIKI